MNSRPAMGGVAAVLVQQAGTYPDKVFLWFGDCTVTFGEMENRARRVAAGLQRLGVGRGDKVALLLPNCVEFVEVWFALAFLGAVIVPVNLALKGDGLAYVLRHSDARVAVVDRTVLGPFLAAHQEAPVIRHVVVRGADGPDGMPYEELAGSGAYAGPPQAELDDLVSILYTSGTTGPAKGVMLSHRAYLLCGRFIADHLELRQTDVLHTTLPLFHINPQQLTIIPSLLTGAPVALEERFSAGNFWAGVNRHRATITFFLGAMMAILAKQTERPDDRENSLRMAVSGAAPKQLWQAFEERFGLHIVEGYGLTETAPGILMNPVRGGKVGSIGVPVPHVEVRVVDGLDQEVAPGMPGEIIVRERYPSTLMSGYYKMEEKTAEAMRGGWFHTGDRGYRDEDGYFYFLDRIKDCIRRRGENISSFDIEKVVLTHPAVLKCAAVGVPSDLTEEDVKVCVVIKPGAMLEPAELLHFCEERMAYFMVPRYVEFRESLPMTATERVQKFELRREGAGRAWDREAAGYRLKRNER